MTARVEAVLEMDKTWPTEDHAEPLDALFGLVSLESKGPPISRIEFYEED